MLIQISLYLFFYDKVKKVTGIRVTLRRLAFTWSHPVTQSRSQYRSGRLHAACVQTTHNVL